MGSKRFVYVLQSLASPAHHYVGLTHDVSTRLSAHNDGHSRHSSSLRPWRVVVAVEFASEASAIAFERYLKTGSWRIVNARSTMPTAAVRRLIAETRERRVGADEPGTGTTSISARAGPPSRLQWAVRAADRRLAGRSARAGDLSAPLGPGALYPTAFALVPTAP